MALIVEDGTGKSDAESYASVQSALDYFDRFGGGDEFIALDEPQQEQALRNATRVVDQSVRWLSTRKTQEQTLEFPRDEFTDTRGVVVKDDEVPTRLVEATIELAGLHAEEDLRTDDPAIIQESFGRASARYASPVKGNQISNIILKSLSIYGTTSTAIRTVYRA